MICVTEPGLQRSSVTALSPPPRGLWAEQHHGGEPAAQRGGRDLTASRATSPAPNDGRARCQSIRGHGSPDSDQRQHGEQ